MISDTDELHAVIFTAARVAQQATVRAMAKATEAAAMVIASLEGTLQSSLQATLANSTALDSDQACIALIAAARAAQEATVRAMAGAVEAAAEASSRFDSDPRDLRQAKDRAHAAIFAAKCADCTCGAKARVDAQIRLPCSLQTRTAMFVVSQLTRESKTRAMTEAAETAARASFEEQLERLNVAGQRARADSDG
jgi:hypothetical protein